MQQNKLCKLLNIESNDILFEKITTSFKEKITQWDYFVNWDKVIRNIKLFEKELHLLNYLVGKKDLRTEAFELFKKYPETIRTIPTLLAIRDGSVDVLIDNKNFIYNHLDFFQNEYTDEEIKKTVEFIINTGLGDLIENKQLKSFVDYATGVEVGLDSNGRKNRGGTLMENLVEEFVKDTCKKLDLECMSQATAKRIKLEWNIELTVDKSSRQIDFAINKNGKLYFIECNFYGGGGSKLKSTATEYVKMNEYWNAQGITFIWVTDGGGWKSTLRPLREYFDKADYLLNLEMLKDGVLRNVITS